METVNAGDVPLEAVLDELLTPDGLSALVGKGAAVCFTLARRTLVPKLFKELISNIDAIDKATREHVAFIVFHGSKSSFTRERFDKKGGRYNLKNDVSDISVSANNPHRAAASRATVGWKPAFSAQHTQQLRYGDAQHSKAVARSTEFATSMLMEHFKVLESQLPCLVFVSSDTLTFPLKIQLCPDQPIQSLYSDVLVPMGDIFQKFELLWMQASRTAELRSQLSKHEEIVDACAAKLPGKQLEVEGVRRRFEAFKTIHSDAHVDKLRWKISQQTRFCEEYKCKTCFEDRIDLIQEHGADSSSLLASVQELRRLEMVKKQIGRQACGVTNGTGLGHSSSAVNRARADLARTLSRIYGCIRADLEYASVELRSLEKHSGILDRELETAERQTQALHLSKQEAEAVMSNGLRTQLSANEVELEGSIANLTRNGFDVSVLQQEEGSSIAILRSLDRLHRLGWQDMQAEGRMSKVKVLFVAANPLDEDALDLEEELRSLRAALEDSRFRDEISFVARGAIRPDDLVRHLREVKPDIVHFSGHGASGGIKLRNDVGETSFVTGLSLARLFTGRGVRLLVLNACYTDVQAAALSDVLGTVVGTTDAVEDEAAHRFSKAFYRTLADGHSIGDAFKDGGDNVDLYGLKDVYFLRGDASSGFLGQARRDQSSNSVSNLP